MFGTEALCLFIHLVGTALVLQLSFPSLQHVALYILSFAKGPRYLSNRARFQGFARSLLGLPKRARLLVAGVGCGCGTALLRAVIDHFSIERWLQLTIWTIMLIHYVTVITEPICILRFSGGLRGCLSCVVASVVTMVESYTRLSNERSLGLAQINHILAGLSIVLSLSFPRRPRIIRDARVVDAEESSSVLGRLCFQWASPLVALAQSCSNISVDDLPELNDRARTGALQEKFAQVASCTTDNHDEAPSLCRILFSVYGKPLTTQIGLSIPLAVLAFTPHGALWVVLNLLEKHPRSKTDMSCLVNWAVVLACSIGLSAWLENWLLWIAMNKIFVPMSQQLTATLYNKAMGFSGQSMKQGVDIRPGGRNLINLVATDIPRIATAGGFLYSNLLQVMKLTVASTLLTYLLGWQSLVGGLFCLVLVSPLHRFCVKRYTKAEQALMNWRDRKTAALTEALNCIQQVKIAALESKWEAKINELRGRELQAHRLSFNWYVMSLVCHLLGPVLVSAVSIGIYHWLYGSLKPSVAFPALSMLGYVQYILGVIPELVSGVVGARVSLTRMDKYLWTKDMPPNIASSDHVEFEGATLTHRCVEATHRPWSLGSVHIRFPTGKLSLICGATGAGKSLLLSAIQGECDLKTGILRRPLPPSYDDIYESCPARNNWVINDAIALVPQMPWNDSGTIRENILFGLPYDPSRYHSVLYACALFKDLEAFEDQDLTDIGPEGIMLSGGQKARLALARALYSRAGVLLLDDIFSAVDVHTAQHLLVHALTGALAEGRTRLLVTHHSPLCLEYADYLVHLTDGTVGFAGQPSTVKHQSLHYDVEGSLLHGEPAHLAPRTPLTVVPNLGTGILMNKKDFRKNWSYSSASPQRSMLRCFFDISGGWWSWSGVAGCYILYNSLLLAQYHWVRLWSESSPSANSNHSITGYYVLGYVAIAGTACLVGGLRSYLAFQAALRASNHFFRRTLHVILRAQFPWLDTVPIGCLHNLFAGDFYLLDSRIGMDLIGLGNAGMDCVGVMMGAILACPRLALIAAILICVIAWYTKQYVRAVRDITHLEATTRSALYEHIHSSLRGLSTIRAFGRTEYYVQQMHAKIDQHAKTSWHLYLLHRWLAFRINVLGTLFSLATALFVVSSNSMTGSLAGFALVFTNHLGHALVTLSRTYATAEMDFNAVERVQEYTGVPTEDHAGVDVPREWPTCGRLSVANLTVGYSPDMPPVLHEVNFDVEPGQRIGIVGRTGAGKSSLALAIFRCLEAQQGAVWIDGVDVRMIKLSHLRRRLAMIPQNPTLFNGTVRSNLDPFSEHSDDALLQALERVSWNSTATDCSSILCAPVADGGSNLSCGQRQLLCLARAVLLRPTLLVLDEATSAIDHTTDDLIQQSLRSAIGGRTPTLLVIAHRLRTIVDFDRVLVLDEGRVVEFDSPQVLIQKSDGLFRRMVDQDIDSKFLHQRIACKGM
ncbi:P-loop containing nucleoside triphosphate hydrolase protein [Aspergillus avenaceus]|uniref:P-loop containing nucleoside triphosphate hydrolase protein n=1 Tax=Aspergillus avenaceus TaxID=36643 RepID=A0A5N6TZ20_ASPAV|nr:P-loop containing nucleoside triphosphate hydrolase protein [Aspergillus avenaceus]